MNFSVPTLLVFGFCVFTEYREQGELKKYRVGEVYYFKNIPTWVRFLVYIANTSIAFYNYITHYDDFLIAGLLILSTNAVVNISKLVVAKDYISIGNTKLQASSFELLGFTKLSDKQSKFSFEMIIRKRKMKKDLFIGTADVAALSQAIDKFKGAQL